jgi:hypothetical protein
VTGGEVEERRIRDRLKGAGGGTKPKDADGVPGKLTWDRLKVPGSGQ